MEPKEENAKLKEETAAERDVYNSDEEAAVQERTAAQLKNESQVVCKLDDTFLIDPECYELDLNHARIAKIENLDQLVNIER